MQWTPGYNNLIKFGTKFVSSKIQLDDFPEFCTGRIFFFQKILEKDEELHAVALTLFFICVYGQKLLQRML